MKKTNRILSLLFTLVLSLSYAAGCTTEGTSSSAPSSEDAETSVEKTWEKSGYQLVNNGNSEYVVVLPASPTSNEYTAAEELKYFLKEATGAELSVVKESDYAISDKSAVICIGETNYADKKGVKTDGTLDRSGYIMKTIDNQLFIRSDGDGLGCVYGVYDLLESSIGYRYYYTDEIYFEETDTVELYEYDEVVDPDFDFRTMSTWNAFLHTNEDYMRRMRTFRRDYNWGWTGEVHIQTRKGGIIPKDEWYDLHKFGTVTEDGQPDHWFSKTGDQLCWMAGEEMYQEAAKDIFERITMEPDKTYFPVSQADTLMFCDCDRCLQAKADWAYNDAGLQLYFLNRVASYVNEWVERDFPGREVRLITLAYYATEEPPVKQDANGKWVAYDERFENIASNIDFYFAPIYTDYSKPLESVENEDVYSNLVKWEDYLEGKENRFLLYTYDTNFHYFFYNFNNFDTFTMQLQTYAEHGVDYVHSQGANGTNQPCFQELRYFVESQILWDTSKNYDELANEFIEHFYKDAAKEIREYYDFTRMRYEQAEVLLNKTFTTIYANIGDKDIWTEGAVNAMDDIFTRAYQKIAHYQTEDPAMYTKLYNRIKELELTVIYTKLKNYSTNYTQAELNLLVDDFNYYVMKFDINCIKEGGVATVGLFDNLKK